jgi:hypothetical protein
VVTRTGEVEDADRLRRLAGPDGQRAPEYRRRRCRPFEARDAPLEHVLRRVHDAAVDEADLGQRNRFAACCESRKTKLVVW